GPGPVGGARSARARRSARRTSWSACPPRRGSPRGPRRAQATLGGLLPDPDLDSGLTQRLGQVDDLGLELGLTGRGTRPASSQARLAGLEELPLPVPDRLLGDLSLT